jgi:site-specific DNA-methyltransferase (adenine-specific)
MTPYYQEAGITIFHGDCRDVLPTIGSGLFRLICTDPPYNVSLEEGDVAFEGRADMKRDFGQWDYEWSPEFLLQEAARLLYTGGSMLSFCSDRLLSAFRTASGLEPRGTLVWQKSNPTPHPRPCYMSATEWIVWLQKPGAPVVWNGNGATSNVRTFPICRGAERTPHPTQKPLALILDLLSRHSHRGDLVLDPYMGSGTTLRAAKDLGRRAVGIEGEERWCEIAAKRLGQDVFDFSEE